MARASTSGKMFSVNMSGHLTCDDVFLATEKTVREREKKRLTIEKTKRERMMKVEVKAKHVLETKGIDGSRWNVADFDAVLTFEKFDVSVVKMISEVKSSVSVRSRFLILS